MYRIGQLRKSNTTSYLTEVGWYASTVQTPANVGSIFTDYAIKAAEDFTPDKAYYLRFSIKRISYQDSRFANTTQYPKSGDTKDPRQMTLTLELFKDNKLPVSEEYEQGTYQVIKNNIVIEPYIEDKNTQYFSFETVFIPNAVYSYLGFILSRTRYDYIENIPRDDVRTGIDLADKGDLAVVNNVLPQPSVDKIGVQTRPGSLICVNKEPIRVGRTGTWEINNGIPVTFVGFVGPNGSDANNIDKFILDYAYDQS